MPLGSNASSPHQLVEEARIDGRHPGADGAATRPQLGWVESDRAEPFGDGAF